MTTESAHHAQPRQSVFSPSLNWLFAFIPVSAEHVAPLSASPRATSGLSESVVNPLINGAEIQRAFAASPSPVTHG